MGPPPAPGPMESDIPKRLLGTALPPPSRPSRHFKGKAWHKGESSRSGRDTDFKRFLFHFGSREFCWCEEDGAGLSVSQVCPPARPGGPMMSCPGAEIHQMPGR